MRIFIIEEGQLLALEKASKRLFTEDRMNGDEMRDAAQIIEAVVRVSRTCEVSPESIANGASNHEGGTDLQKAFHPAGRAHRALPTLPFHAICGADQPNQKTTQIPQQVTCPTCLTMQEEGDTR